jgi:hypothetical protein
LESNGNPHSRYTFNNNNNFGRVTFFMLKEPGLRLVRQALIALAVRLVRLYRYINEKLQIL